MKNYFVEIGSRTGEREDIHKSIVTAPDEYTAGKQGIENQAYGYLEWDGEDFDGAYDLHGEIYLCVNKIREVTEDEYNILKRFL